MQLQEHYSAFEAAGIGVVAMTYDSADLLAAFADQWKISYPLLADVDTRTFSALGILNTDYQPGDSAYGIPWPGIFVINRERRIVGKIFLEGYTHRVSAPAVLAYANRQLD